MTNILNGFVWGFIGACLVISLLGKRKWPLTKEGVLKMVEH